MQELSPGDKVVVVVCEQCSDCQSNAPEFSVPGITVGSVFLLTDVLYHAEQQHPGVRIKDYPMPKEFDWLCSCELRKIDPSSDEFARKMRACRPVTRVRTKVREHDEELEDA